MKTGDSSLAEAWRDVDDPSDDPRVVAAALEYQSELEAGKRPNRTAFLERHGDYADELAKCIDGLEMLMGSLSRSGLKQPKPMLSPPELAGQPLGDFKIVREIGRGGMGIVYEAEQLSLGRTVALKVLPLAASFDPKHRQRFLNEARAAACLHHNHIVPVYAVGAERGVHYYAMQLIEGQSLAALLGDLRNDAGVRLPGEPLSSISLTASYPGMTNSAAAYAPTARGAAISTVRSTDRRRYYQTVARWIKEAAEALEHAHQAGIVHRDVKPGNLLIDGAGALWVADFGLALFSRDAGLTVTGEVLGTLRYASPEQVLGKPGLVDHRSDVYSLGATLYELLTLRPLFDGKDRRQILNQIATDEPLLPSKHDREVPHELETIALKAIAKNPSDRYASAQELADDLGRFLEHKPIQAKRAGPIERAGKWARRHRSLVGMGAGFAVLGFLGMLVATALIARAYEKEKQRTEEAQKQRKNAEDSLRDARKAVDLIATIADQEMPNHPALQGIRRQMLEAALLYYQGFVERYQDSPDIQAELAESQTKLRTIIDELVALQTAGSLRLITQPPVQDDLGLGDEQRKDIDKLGRDTYVNFETLREMREMRDQGPDGWRHWLAKRALQFEKGVLPILSPEQLKRLKQISLQARGIQAFQDPEVEDVLKLTTEQKAFIRQKVDEAIGFVYREMSRPMNKGPKGPNEGQPKGGGFKGGFDPPGGGFKNPNFESRRPQVDAVLAKLSPEQLAKWQEMIGEPFKGQIGPGGPQPGRNPPP